jgi:hypothetical protein
MALALGVGLALFGSPAIPAAAATEEDILPKPAAEVVISGGSKKERATARKALRDWGAHTHISSVTFMSLNTKAKALTYPYPSGVSRIELSPGLEPSDLKSTLAHEIGHATIAYLYRHDSRRAEQLKWLGFKPQALSSNGEEAAADCMEQVKTDDRHLAYMPSGCSRTQKWMAAELWSGRRPMKTSTAKISGRPAVGAKLTANPQAKKWTTGTRLSYQWYRGTKPIKGATAPTYRVRAADIGKKLSVKVTGTKSGYASRTTQSPKTRKVASRT